MSDQTILHKDTDDEATADDMRFAEAEALRLHRPPLREPRSRRWHGRIEKGVLMYVLARAIGELTQC